MKKKIKIFRIISVLIIIFILYEIFIVLFLTEYKTGENITYEKGVHTQKNENISKESRLKKIL